MRKRVFIYLTCGLAAALLLTACAGVAAGQLDLPVVGQPLFGPSVEVLSAPDVAVVPVAREMQMTADKLAQADAALLAAPLASTVSQVAAQAGLLTDAEEFGCSPGH